jgi:hypothetical protein
MASRTSRSSSGGILAEFREHWRDDNAVGSGSFIDPTPRDDSFFTTPGNQGDQHRLDLLTVLEHEVGQLLGKQREASGVIIDTLSAGDIACAVRHLQNASVPIADSYHELNHWQ